MSLKLLLLLLSLLLIHNYLTRTAQFSKDSFSLRSLKFISCIALTLPSYLCFEHTTHALFSDFHWHKRTTSFSCRFLPLLAFHRHRRATSFSFRFLPLLAFHRHRRATSFSFQLLPLLFPLLPTPSFIVFSSVIQLIITSCTVLIARLLNTARLL